MTRSRRPTPLGCAHASPQKGSASWRRSGLGCSPKGLLLLLLLLLQPQLPPPLLLPWACQLLQLLNHPAKGVACGRSLLPWGLHNPNKDVVRNSACLQCWSRRRYRNRRRREHSGATRHNRIPTRRKRIQLRPPEGDANATGLGLWDGAFGGGACAPWTRLQRATLHQLVPPRSPAPAGRAPPDVWRVSGAPTPPDGAEDTEPPAPPTTRGRAPAAKAPSASRTPAAGQTRC